MAEVIDQIRELDGYIVGFVTGCLESQKGPKGFSLDLLKKSRAELVKISGLSEVDRPIFASADHSLRSLEELGDVLNRLL